MEQSATYLQAIKLLNQGFSVIPLVPRGKKPLINWTEFQTRYATQQEIEQWFTKWPDANTGIVTGQISGIVVVDFDSNEAFGAAQLKGLPITPTVKTSRGCHVYFKWRHKVFNFQKRDDLPGVDLRGDGGYVVGPGSTHESGHIYHCVEGDGLDDVPLAEIPDWVTAAAPAQKNPLKELYKGVPDGSRNDSLARLVGSWVNDGLSMEECLSMARTVNQRNTPPDEDKNVVETVQSIFTKHHNSNVGDVEEVEDFVRDIFPQVQFPLDVFPEDLKQFIVNTSIAFNVPVEVVAVGVLAILSVAIGNSIRVSPKADWQEAVFIWLIIIGRSGSGKTPPIKKLLKPINDLQKDECRIFNKAWEEYELNLENYKKKSKKIEMEISLDDKPEKPLLKHYKVSDATIEALADIMKTSPRGILLHQDEISGLILGFNQYKNKGNDRQKILELWNCDPWKVDRVTAGTKYVHDTGCGILGGIQPLVLPAVFKEDSISDGLLPRFLFTVITQDSVYTGDSLSWKDEQFWQEMVKGFYDSKLKKDDFGNNSPRIIKFDQYASDIYKKFKQKYKEQGKYLPERARVFLPKLEAYAIRISGILHILRHQTEDHIQAQTLNDSIRIVDYFAGQAMAVITEYGKPSQLSEIEITLIKVLVDLKTKVVHGKLKLSEITAALNGLLPQHVQQTPESISSILTKKLKFKTKPSGGYSHLLWDDAKIDSLFILHLRKTSTTPTTSTNPVEGWEQ